VSACIFSSIESFIDTFRYLIGQTVGGVFCSPISEAFGRRTLYILCALIFCAANIVTAAVPHIVAVYIGRFVAGFVAAVPATMAFGNFTDTHDDQVRVWIVYFYTFTGNLGLVVGPIYGAYIVENLGWRWVYYIATIIAGASAAAAMLMKESHAEQLLEKRVDNVRKESDNKDLKTSKSEEDHSVKIFLRDCLFRPLEFLFTEPVVAFCAILCSIAYGLIYGSTESLTIVYESFGWSETTTSLAFIPLAIGLMLDILPRFYDAHIHRQYEKEGKQIKPETKLTSFAIACPALAIGLWIFAWTIPPRVENISWVPSTIGLVLIGFATNDFAYVLFGYVTDLYGPLGASAVSSLSLSRTLVAAAFPLFTSQMYKGLGANIATSILAAVATLFAFTPFLFLNYTSKLKHFSKFCESDDEGEDDKGEGGETDEQKSTHSDQV